MSCAVFILSRGANSQLHLSLSNLSQLLLTGDILRSVFIDESLMSLRPRQCPFRFAMCPGDPPVPKVFHNHGRLCGVVELAAELAEGRGPRCDLVVVLLGNTRSYDLRTGRSGQTDNNTDKLRDFDSDKGGGKRYLSIAPSTRSRRGTPPRRP